MSYARGTRVFYQRNTRLSRLFCKIFRIFFRSSRGVSAHHKLDQPHRTLCRIIGDRPGRRLCQTSRLPELCHRLLHPGLAVLSPIADPDRQLRAASSSAASSRADSASVLVAFTTAQDL